MNLVAFVALALFTLGDGPNVDSIRDADEGGNRGTENTVEPYDSYFVDSTCRLSVAKEVPFPEGRFEIFKRLGGSTHEDPYSFFNSRGGSLNRADYAYLRPRQIVSSVYPLRATIAELKKNSSPFEDQTSFLNKDRVRTRLTRVQATRLWGEPRRNSNYYTFDAKNFHHGEENIFHLDLYFGDEGFVESYRIRGIEIAAPSWLREHYTLLHGYSFDYQPDYPVSDPLPEPLLATHRWQTRTAIKCGDKKAILDLCIRNGKGWIELNSDTFGGSDSVHPNWFETCCVLDHNIGSNYYPYARPTLKALSDWWGIPRHSSESFYTFDISCQQNGEPDIFHVDVVCDKDFNITDSRLRGPSIADAQWQVKVQPRIQQFGHR